jgi:hypothetical protein
MSKYAYQGVEGHEKRSPIGPDDYLAAGERRATPLVPFRGGLEVDDRLSRGRVKIAACDDAVKAASQVQPQPGRVYALVIGLGSEGHWGTNNNGDAFPEEALLGQAPKGLAMGFFDKFARRIPKEWGYRTFKKAHVFQEHHNSNPKLAIGGVENTFWNDRMHRVENLVWVDRANPKGIKWARRIDENDPTVGTSMACHVPFDRCSICGNLAPTRMQYCGHLRRGHPDYALRQIRPDGRSVSMINDFPDFFDESFVEVPAAPEALLIAKVASQGGATKQSEMEKHDLDLSVDVAMDDLNGLYARERGLPTSVLDKLAAHGLPAAITAAGMLGMCLRPSEVYHIAFGPDALDPKTAAAVDAKALQLAPEPLPEHLVEKLAASAKLPLAGRPGTITTGYVVDLLRPFAPGRSYQEPYLTPRLMKSASRPVTPQPLTDSERRVLAAYHGMYKLASGFCGYGERQAKLAHLGRYGSY